MWHENRFTKKLGIQYPIIQAGMAGGITTPGLIAAVSNAGGLGTLGAGYMSPEQMTKAIRKIKELTNQHFGVNIFIPEMPEVAEKEIEKANELLRPFREELKLKEPEVTKPKTNLFDKQIEIILEERVPVCSFTFGVPSKQRVHQLKQENIVVMGTATTVKEAIINEENGLDMVVMQGSEAGGHRGTFSGSYDKSMIGTMSLVPQAADHVDIPVIAAGGIMDGRGVLAALTLGAEAVQMGTAFLTSMESGAKKLHIEKILDSIEEQTVITQAFSGKPARGIQNEFITRMAPYEQNLPGYPVQNILTKEIRNEAAKQNRPEWVHIWSGQSVRLSKRQPAGEMIRDIVSQVDVLLKNR
ncbi:NAD(P)H-dependent flavin oxidoreductase [Halobacillus karajensis]|uniref:Probable nitronate monooxygenase n=1 Tax=Halobacillus karajensis TaxID=195088 RepID=A0A024P3M2_9BACI|nr:nitronate monooxygenase [Halobacillus karajensis]CDQ20027.1 Nitronate monooxygenase [Halobacillus karajensis]CDQ22486.1 Nitronate monooxygenase [Halobacillus karajensis]CDQ28330.1 Nitronate monooxygenase [Halobacillus karajensis]